ncbi:MAG: hypothetical protein JWN75_65 [Candidatus Saccharibacteria bacterium]|nr:hypothetical protein [Candidatus Saccharibacteria bacterium]
MSDSIYRLTTYVVLLQLVLSIQRRGQNANVFARNTLRAQNFRV